MDTAAVTPHLADAQPNSIGDIIKAAISAIGNQVLLSQGRCVDVLLDLYLATDDLNMRWSIADRLDDIRFLNVVEASDFHADLTAIADIASSSASSSNSGSTVAAVTGTLQPAA